MDNVTPEYSFVNDSLAGKSILLTGTTGFLGKAILEKILRSVPSVEKIAVLIRPSSDGTTAETRLKRDILENPIFDTLKATHKSNFTTWISQKITIIDGALTEERLGLSSEEFSHLANNIDIIINSAASVNFQEPLDQALRTNTDSVRQIAKLANKGKKSPVVQVSTCFVNGFNKGQMNEAVVSPTGKHIEKSKDGHYRVDSLIKDLQNKVQTTIRQESNEDKRRAQLVDLGMKESHRFGWNDTYTFTKWMAENILLHELRYSTLSIVRPSIIESSWKEPTPGWIEGVKVADAIIYAYARGKTIFFPGKKDAIVDIIPVDVVANSVIIAAAEALSKPGYRRIYQACSSTENPITVERFKDLLQDGAAENHQALSPLLPKKPERPLTIVSRKWFTLLESQSKYPLSAIKALESRIGTGKFGKALENFDTTLRLSNIFSFYTSPNYTFNNQSLLKLHRSLPMSDRRNFNISVHDLDWKQYLGKNHLEGLNKFVFCKERPAIKKSTPTTPDVGNKTTKKKNVA